MPLSIEQKDIEKIIMVGDRLLIKPSSPLDKTKSGLFLPPSVQDNDPIQSGYVIKVGPGYPIPAVQDDEPWKGSDEKVKYIPLQSRIGDLAVYLQKSAFEIEFNNEKYCIIPNSAVLMLIRDDGMFQ